MRLAPLPALAFVATLLLGALVTPGAALAQTVAGPTPVEAAYLAATKPFRDRIGLYQEALLEYQQAAVDGQIETVSVTAFGDLTRELFAARQAFTDASPSARLDQYDRTIKLAIDRAYAASVLLLRAQVTESAADREALIREAAEQTRSSTRLFGEAADELRALVPVTGR
jgi:hypothetical protein